MDPDNRRPVDFVQRHAVIRELVALDGEPAVAIRDTLADWLRRGDFDRLKLWTIHRLLAWRARHPLVFDAGNYVAVPVRGQRARHCLAYARCHGDRGVLVLATRLYRQLGFPCPDSATGQAATLRADPQSATPDPAASPGSIWGDTEVDLTAAGIRAHRFVDLLTRRVEHTDATTRVDPSSEPASADPSSPLRLDRLLETLPLAVLAFEIEP